jgi:hypothetical protein
VSVEKNQIAKFVSPGAAPVSFLFELFFIFKVFFRLFPHLLQIFRILTHFFIQKANVLLTHVWESGSCYGTAFRKQSKACTQGGAVLTTKAYVPSILPTMANKRRTDLVHSSIR